MAGYLTAPCAISIVSPFESDTGAVSAAGLSIGLGARREFGLLISCFSMDVYLCDPERRVGLMEHC